MVTGFFPTGSASFDFWNVNTIGKHKAIAVTYCSSYSQRYYCQGEQHFLKNYTPELTVNLRKLMLLLKTLESALFCPLNKSLNTMKAVEEGCAVILHWSVLLQRHKKNIKVFAKVIELPWTPIRYGFANKGPFCSLHHGGLLEFAR